MGSQIRLPDPFRIHRLCERPSHDGSKGSCFERPVDQAPSPVVKAANQTLGDGRGPRLLRPARDPPLMANDGTEVEARGLGRVDPAGSAENLFWIPRESAIRWRVKTPQAAIHVRRRGTTPKLADACRPQASISGDRSTRDLPSSRRLRRSGAFERTGAGWLTHCQSRYTEGPGSL